MSVETRLMYYSGHIFCSPFGWVVCRGPIPRHNLVSKLRSSICSTALRAFSLHSSSIVYSRTVSRDHKLTGVPNVTLLSPEGWLAGAASWLLLHFTHAHRTQRSACACALQSRPLNQRWLRSGVEYELIWGIRHFLNHGIIQHSFSIFSEILKVIQKHSTEFLS